MRRVFLSCSACALAIAVGAPASASAASFSLTAAGGLLPSYSTAQSDYVAPCPGNAVSLTVNVPSGVSVAVDGKRVTTGRKTVNVAVTPGQRFSFSNGRYRHWIRCTPADFPKWTATGTLPATSPFLAINATTLTVGSAPYGIVIDSSGAPLWWRRAAGVGQAANGQGIAGGSFGFWHGDILNGEATENGVFEQFALNGTSLREYRAVGGPTDLHEATFLPNGNVMMIAIVNRSGVNLSSLGGPSNGTIVDNVIQEIGPDGNVLWAWRVSDHIPVSAASRWYPILKVTSGTGPVDIFHLNSVEPTADGGYVISFRHLDSVFKIRKSDGAILWKLGGTSSAQSLSVRSDTVPQGSTFGGQHDARVLSDGTVTVFDNGSNGTGAAYVGRAPRVTRWRIDTVAKTATLVERIVDAEVKSSFAAGGARRLSDGSWIVSWAHWPWIRSYSAAHRLGFNLKYSNGRASYRAVPVSGSGFTRAAFAAGMDAQYPR